MVSLITQRSQVQILPPLQSKTAGQRRFSERSGSRLWRFSTAGCPHLSAAGAGLVAASAVEASYTNLDASGYPRTSSALRGRLFRAVLALTSGLCAQAL